MVLNAVAVRLGDACRSCQRFPRPTQVACRERLNACIKHERLADGPQRAVIGWLELIVRLREIQTLSRSPYPGQSAHHLSASRNDVRTVLHLRSVPLDDSHVSVQHGGIDSQYLLHALTGEDEHLQSDEVAGVRVTVGVSASTVQPLPKGDELVVAQPTFSGDLRLCRNSARWIVRDGEPLLQFGCGPIVALRFQHPAIARVNRASHVVGHRWSATRIDGADSLHDIRGRHLVGLPVFADDLSQAHEGSACLVRAALACRLEMVGIGCDELAERCAAFGFVEGHAVLELRPGLRQRHVWKRAEFQCLAFALVPFDGIPLRPHAVPQMEGESA